MEEPSKYLIKYILKLNDGEMIGDDELEAVRMKMKLYPACKKYLNYRGWNILREE